MSDMFTLYHYGDKVCEGLSIEQAVDICRALAGRYDYFQIEAKSGERHKWDYFNKLFVPQWEE